MPRATVRIIEIAEILGVSKQRAHQIAEEKSFPAPGRTRRTRPIVEAAGGHGVGEGMADREAMALANAGADEEPDPSHHGGGQSCLI
jgi:hypothetical protein